LERDQLLKKQRSFFTSEEKQLFKKGDGINVYEEPVFILNTYEQCITLYCKDNHLNLTSIDVDNIIQHLEDLFATLVEDERLYDDAYFRATGNLLGHDFNTFLLLCCLTLLIKFIVLVYNKNIGKLLHDFWINNKSLKF
jgi:hypothetical protein